jgi:hypothetical protein
MKINTGCWVDGCKCFDSDDEDGVEIKRDREWQGLTEGEMAAAWSQSKGDVLQRLNPFARAIEQALKDKNT